MKNIKDTIQSLLIKKDSTGKMLKINWKGIKKFIITIIGAVLAGVILHLLIDKSLNNKTDHESIRSILIFVSSDNIYPFQADGIKSSMKLNDLIQPLMTYPLINNNHSPDEVPNFDVFDWCPSKIDETMKIEDVPFPGIVFVIPKYKGNTNTIAGEIKLRALSEEGKKMKLNDMIEKQIEIDRDWSRNK